MCLELVLEIEIDVVEVDSVPYIGILLSAPIKETEKHKLQGDQIMALHFGSSIKYLLTKGHSITTRNHIDIVERHLFSLQFTSQKKRFPKNKVECFKENPRCPFLISLRT